MGLFERIVEAVAAIRKVAPEAPQVALIPGTGLDGIVDRIERGHEIPFGEIPGFAETTATTHKSTLVLGTLGGKRVAAMGGRHHLYEGFSAEEVTFPTRVLRALGADVLIVSNAAGGMNPRYALGDIMLIEDHINLMGANPLVGLNDDRLGPRFPDMCRPYSRRLLDLAESIALDEGIRVHQGVYVAVVGPNLETRAEYRFLRGIGADCVGMSTVPEVIVGVQAGFEILGITCVTDRCLPDALEPADIGRIIATAQAAAPRLTRLVERVIAEC
ncbi:MAG TPA: purine-nucleoside phosphorylase [Planctomycetota bacterium]|nr:purine-nucleoside phosphorylase [Planctomycetota bacterium]